VPLSGDEHDVAWARQAETCKEFLSKGRQVCVEGRLTQDRWEDKNTGQKRSKVFVTAERVQFLGGPRDSAPEQPPPNQEVGF